MSVDWPLTGRESELAYLQRSVLPDGPGVVVAGDLGVGKTRLCDSLVERLEDEGWVVSRHLATEARSALAFSVFATLLDGEHLPTDPLQRVQDAARRLAGPDRLLLYVDDAHWLDPESLAFVQHVAESAGARTLLTLRSGHPRAERVASAARRAGLVRLELQPLAEAEVGALVSTVWPDVTPAQLGALWRITRGNPLYLHQLVDRAGVAGPGSPLDVRPLAEVVGDRLRGLDEAEQAVLELLVVGGLLELSLLAELGGEATVARLEDLALLSVVESGGRLVVRLAHPVFAEVLGAQMGPAVRRLRRAELLAALDRRPNRRRSDLVALAVWGVEQGDAVDPEVLVAAARALVALEGEVLPDEDGIAAEGRGRPLVAATLARAACEGGGGFEAARCWFDIEAHADGTSSATADALVLMGRTAGSEAERALALSAAASLHALNGWEDVEATFDELRELRAHVSEEAAQRHVDAALVFALALFGRTRDAVDLGVEVLGDPATSARDRLVVAGPLVGALVVLGRPLAALERSSAAFAELPPDPDSWSLGALTYTHIVALVMAGRIVDGLELVDQVLATIDAAGGDGRMGLFGSLRGDVSLMRGRPGDAFTAAETALATDHGAGVDPHSGRTGHAHAVAAMAHALRGDAREATAAMARADACRDSSDIFRAFAGRARGWVAVAEGRPTDAVALFQEAADGFGDNRDATLWCRHDLVRLGVQGSGAPMRALLDDAAEGDYWAACTAHAEAFDADDGAGLDAAASALEGVGATLLAAEAAAQAGVAHERVGDRAAAASSRARSVALAAACEGASTPALALAGSTDERLTPRELEVARLAANGASNRAIAAALHVSVRTAETYVYRVCFKLGASSRAELADHPDL